jgi:hypothetical protein
MQCAWAIFSSVQLYNIFPHYLINGTILEKQILNIKCVFRVSLQFLSEIFFILRRTERAKIKNIYWSSCKVTFISVRFERNLNFLSKFSKKKHSNIKFHDNASCGNRVPWDRRTDERTDRYDETNSLFSKCFERA